jgi:hypothetical protein
MTPITTLYSALILHRPILGNINEREAVKFVDIIWAKPYRYNAVYGTLVLHACGDFRFYRESYDNILKNVCEFVGRLAKQGHYINNMPEFPWVTSTPPL